MYPRIAYVTAAPDPDLELALAALERARLDVEAVPWDAGIAWDDFDLVLVRSAWQDAGRRQEFLRWARAVEEQTLLANPARLLARTSDRTLLRDLAGRGVPTVAAVWFEPGDDAAAFGEALRDTGWPRLTVAANIRGACADEVYADPTAAAGRAQSVAAGGGVAMVHPAAAGGVSVIVLGGAASHAVGPQGPVEVPSQALDLLRQLPTDDMLYARMELVSQDGQLVLADLDAAAPHLDLAADHEAADRLARAVRLLLSPPTQE